MVLIFVANAKKCQMSGNFIYMLIVSRNYVILYTCVHIGVFVFSRIDYRNITHPKWRYFVILLCLMSYDFIRSNVMTLLSLMPDDFTCQGKSQTLRQINNNRIVSNFVSNFLNNLSNFFEFCRYLEAL